MATFHELLEHAKSEIREIGVEEARRELETRREGIVLLDVREREEQEEGYIDGALLLPRGFLELKIEGMLPDKSRPIIVYCAGGVRSALAAQALLRLGYRDVRSLAGGFSAWKRAGFPFRQPRFLNAEDRRRYSRHLLIPEVGEAGQIRMLESKVLLIGAGGLGSPAAYYLAAAGIGTIGIVDDDVVDESNLQRQILHDTKRVGRPKTDSARETLLALNPGIEVKTYPLRLGAENVLEIFEEYDVIVDGSDNFQTRYLVNDACVMLGKPNVHGSIFRFEGQITVFVPGEGPCYRCLYPEPPPPELAPSCQEAGVLGVLPGVIGVLQAIETIKLVLGIGETLNGRLLLFDAL
ncbi:MAG: molybdopterin-synthase adenylyltransferase MoeB, partial [Deltaproteobacteria bacterium]